MNPTINRKLSFVGVPLDLGAGKRGVDMGPMAIRYAGVKKRLTNIGYDVNDRGDLEVNRNAPIDSEGTHLKYLHEVAKVNQDLCNSVDEIIKAGEFPLVLGGDHSIAIGTIAGVLQHKKNLGVIWFDAHGDINTAETSPSGNIHGMPVAVSMGFGHEMLTAVGGVDKKLDPKNFVLIGARDLDKGERELYKKLGVKVFTMHEVDLLGIAEVVRQAIEIASNGTDGVHVSFDLDAMDPQHAPGVGTPVLGGLTYRESHLAMELLQASKVVTSAEFVEVNTVLDNNNQTAKAAVALIGSLMGESLI